MKINAKSIYGLYSIGLSFVLSVLGTLISRGNVLDAVAVTPYIATLIMLVLLYNQLLQWRTFTTNWSLLLLTGICALSAVINADVALWSCFALLFVVSQMLKTPEETILHLLLGTALGQVFFLFWYGIISDWNGHSICTAFAFTVFLSFLLYRNKLPYTGVLFVAFLFEAILVVMSSRAAIIAYSAAAVYLLLVARKIKAVKKFLRIALLLLVAIVAIYRYRDVLLSLFLHKWELQGVENATTFSGREEIWTNELTRGWTWFGNGSDYFIRVYEHADAHNIFVQMLGRYGGIAAVAFLLFMIALYIRAFKHKHNPCRIIVIPVLLVYLCAGMFENLLFYDCKMYIPSVMFLLVLSLVFRKDYASSEQPEVQEGTQ